MNISTFKIQMSKLMKQAWFLVKKLGWSISEAMKQAWKNFKLRRRLINNTVSFSYKKKDGSIREAVGTLLKTAIPAIAGERKSDPVKVQVYYDLEKQQWRSFNIESLI